jgi:hypothetical protein
MSHCQTACTLSIRPEYRTKVLKQGLLALSRSMSHTVLNDDGWCNASLNVLACATPCDSVQSFPIFRSFHNTLETDTCHRVHSRHGRASGPCMA